MSRFLLLAVVLLAAALPARAQSGALRRVVLTDGSVFVGTIADEAADPLVVITTDGVTRTFDRARVAEITDLIAGRFRRLDPTRTRLLLAPTARTMGGGEARLSLLSYIVPNVTYGVTDRIDISATGFLSFGDGAGVLPLLGAKATVIEQDGVQAAIGASTLIPIAGGVDGFVVVPYGVVTVGSDVRSLTVAVGGAIAGSFDGPVESADGVVVSVGGEIQVSNSVKLLAESYVPIGGGAAAFAVLPGVRFFGDRFSIDVYGIAGGFRDRTSYVIDYDPVTFEPTFRDRDEFVAGALAPFVNASYRF